MNKTHPTNGHENSSYVLLFRFENDGIKSSSNSVSKWRSWHLSRLRFHIFQKSDQTSLWNGCRSLSCDVNSALIYGYILKCCWYLKAGLPMAYVFLKFHNTAHVESASQDTRMTVAWREIRCRMINCINLVSSFVFRTLSYRQHSFGLLLFRRPDPMQWQYLPHLIWLSLESTSVVGGSRQRKLLL